MVARRYQLDNRLTCLARGRIAPEVTARCSSSPMGASPVLTCPSLSVPSIR
jgi:hypothetical protein